LLAGALLLRFSVVHPDAPPAGTLKTFIGLLSLRHKNQRNILEGKVVTKKTKSATPAAITETPEIQEDVWIPALCESTCVEAPVYSACTA